MPDPRILATILAVALALPVIPLHPDFGAALAQDDDGDDGGDDDGGDDDGGDDDDESSDRSGDDGDDDAPSRRQADPQRQAAPPAPVERPARAPREILVTGLTAVDLQALLAQGFSILDETAIARNGPLLHRLRAPEGVALDDARARVRATPSGASADYNHYYRTSQDIIPAAGDAFPPMDPPCTHLNCAAQTLVGWPASRPPTCRAPITIGVIDTGVNLDHAGLPKTRIELVRLADPDLADAGAMHGTSVVSMLVGTEARAPGLLREARVLAVDVFSREAGDDRADAATLIRAIDLLSQRGIRVANLSLAGPYNKILADMLGQVEAEGMLVVAAAGNGGPAAPKAWPAASDRVLAVTAVDSSGRIYRRAQRGDHLDVAAPGVEVWAAASVRGVKARTGTSFAVPWAAAAAAILMARDAALTPADAIALLRAMTVDAGEAGVDPVFGHGILRLEALCE